MVNNGKPLNKQASAEHDLAAESRQALESLRESEKSRETSNQAHTASENSCSGDTSATITGPSLDTDAERDFQGLCP